VVEDFTDGSWHEHWKPYRGTFLAASGGIVSQGAAENFIFCDRKFSGPVAIEYDAECLPGFPLCDLSAVWCSDLTLAPDRSRITQVHTPYYLQFGGFDGSLSGITQGSGTATLSASVIKPVLGHQYHVRAQIADDRLDLFVEGKLICSWTNEFSFNAGYVGLFGFYPGKAYRHVRIYTRGVAKKVPATAVGDAFVQSGYLEDAAAQYHRVADSFPDSAIGREASYKEGLCADRRGDIKQALAIWQPLRHSEYAGRIALADIEQLSDQGRFEEVLAGMQAICASDDPDLRARIAIVWGTASDRLRKKHDNAMLTKYMAFHDAELSQEIGENRNAAECLTTLRRFQEIIQKYPDQSAMCMGAYLNMGNPEKVIADFTPTGYIWNLAAFSVGEFGGMNPNISSDLESRALLYAGRLTELRARFPDEADSIASALAFEGHADEALAVKNQSLLNREKILCNAGRYADLPSTGASLRLFYLSDPSSNQVFETYGFWMQIMVSNRAGMEAWIQGRHEDAIKKFHNAMSNPYPVFFTPEEPDFEQVMFHFFAVPLLTCAQTRDYLDSCRQVKKAVGRCWEQRISYASRYLLGEMSDATFLSQPSVLYAHADLTLLQGLKADNEHRYAAARAAYALWLSTPPWQRAEIQDPSWTLFIHYRVSQFPPGATP